jgi:hypothetical protein
MRTLGIAALCTVLGGCTAINVRETTLSTNQKVAIVSSPGDGVSPPSSTVLVASRHGQFVPVSTGYAQAPVTAALSGAVGGMAIGAGNYAAARVLRPTQVNQVQTGGNVTGATASSQGASANASGGTGFGGSAFGGSTSSTSFGGSSTAFGGSGGSGGLAFGGSGGSGGSAFGGSGGSAFGGSSTAIGGSGGTAISSSSANNF